MKLGPVESKENKLIKKVMVEIEPGSTPLLFLYAGLNKAFSGGIIRPLELVVDEPIVAA